MSDYDPDFERDIEKLRAFSAEPYFDMDSLYHTVLKLKSKTKNAWKKHCHLFQKVQGNLAITLFYATSVASKRKEVQSSSVFGSEIALSSDEKTIKTLYLQQVCSSDHDAELLLMYLHTHALNVMRFCLTLMSPVITAVFFQEQEDLQDILPDREAEMRKCLIEVWTSEMPVIGQAYSIQNLIQAYQSDGNKLSMYHSQRQAAIDFIQASDNIEAYLDLHESEFVPTIQSLEEARQVMLSLTIDYLRQSKKILDIGD